MAKGKPGKPRRIFVRMVTLTVVILLAAGLFVAWINVLPGEAAFGRMYASPEEVPSGRVGLVFGCDDKFQGRPNKYFDYRIDAAARLWHEGKLSCIIVSGDNRTEYYNEPKKMRQALIRQGVPAGKVVCDFAGLRTLDSVVRAKEIFGVEKVVFISQQFQNERAIWLAKANGIDAIAFNAQDIKGQSSLRVRLREVGARVKMWLDVHILDTAPTRGGEKIALPL